MVHDLEYYLIQQVLTLIISHIVHPLVSQFSPFHNYFVRAFLTFYLTCHMGFRTPYSKLHCLSVHHLLVQMVIMALMVGVFYYPRTSSLVTSGGITSISGTPRLLRSLSSKAHEDSIATSTINVMIPSVFMSF